MSEEEFWRKKKMMKMKMMMVRKTIKILTDNNITRYGQTTDFDFQR